ncbi:MAG TPA: amylo-alpha-1,6-glucosidase, partial [Thermoanaerobaculia bacterium]|nr:amylo-alpha-1,6-glucosidase [Thermoanaerobaculia bacterium]
MLSIRIDREITQDLERAASLEWLETNGLGGWAGTTVAGLHSRSDHGLLVAALETPARRTVLLSRLDETLTLDGEDFHLACNQFPGAIAPRGFEHLTSFEKTLFPVFEYEAGGVRLKKTVAAVDGENTTLVLYEVLEAPGPFVLTLRPFLPARGPHALTLAHQAAAPETAFEPGVLQLRANPDAAGVSVEVPEATFEADPQWWYRFEYEMDRQRGYDFREDLWTPGALRRELGPGDRLGVVISALPLAGSAAAADVAATRDAFALFDKERRRREKILKSLPVQDSLARFLSLSADAFLVRRAPGSANGASGGPAVLAGYPWSAEHSRDTLIALPGLCLVTGRHDEAKKILRAFARGLDKGLLPEHTAADAPLWLFVAVHKYLQATGDETFVKTLLPALRKVVHHYDRGTRHGIRTDADGLVAIGDPNAPPLALTWMDATVGGRPVTPRTGKAVEVNALWYNALTILAALEERLGDADEAKHLVQRARRVQKRFGEVFWNEEKGYLNDTVPAGPDADGTGPDASLRPNQVFALSLPFPLLSKGRAAWVLKALEDQLYTPVGLRTLAPTDPQYCFTSAGDPTARALAAHQGTVWTWLLGPYLTALVHVRGAAGRRKALEAIQALRPRLAEAGLGSLSEIYDAEPPHTSRGCIARAWSVAEVLRAYIEDIHP